MFCFLLIFPGGIFLVILRPVSTSPPQGGARRPFRARELGFVRSAFWYVFATTWGFCSRGFSLPPSTPALSDFVFVSIFQHSSRFPFSLPPLPSLICGSGSSHACRTCHSLECFVPCFPSSILCLRFSALAISMRLRSLAG